MTSTNGTDDENLNQSLITESRVTEEDRRLSRRICAESKQLWRIVGPAVFSRLSGFSMNVVTQAFAGHLGEVELAAISIANTVIVGFSFGLILGMASALETLCGQAFGAKRHNMLGIYLQRSWIVLFLFSVIMLPIFVFAAPILKLLGQTEAVAELTGQAAMWMIPVHFSFTFQLTLQRFLQCQVRNQVTAFASVSTLALNFVLSWLLVYVLDFGVVGAAVSLGLACWFNVAVLFLYVSRGDACVQTWTGFSVLAFTDLWEFFKLSVASGIMLCLENWYYRILILMTGYFKNATIDVGALTICLTIEAWELMIPLAFFAGTGVRVANELGAGNGKAAKFATKVSVSQSALIGLFFSALILILHDKYGYIFSSSDAVIQATDHLSFLLAITILLNSVQPILSAVAVGCGWQAWVAWINLGCYYIIGLPLGSLMGWVFNTGVMGMWGGMIIGGTAIQTLILTIMTARCDWEKEAEKAIRRVQKWSITPDSEDGQTGESQHHH